MATISNPSSDCSNSSSRKHIPLVDGNLVLFVWNGELRTEITIPTTTRNLSQHQLRALTRALRYDLEKVLDNDRSRMEFEDYLQKVSNQENYLFLRACDEFQHLRSSANRFKSAKIIMETYIFERSHMEINTGQAERKKMIDMWNGKGQKSLTKDGEMQNVIGLGYCPKNLFDDMCSIVMFQLKTDVFPRFVASKDFAGLLKSLTSSDGLTNALEMLGGEPKEIFSDGPLPNQDDNEREGKLNRSNSMDSLSSESNSSQHSSTLTYTSEADHVSSISPQLRKKRFISLYVNCQPPKGITDTSSSAFERFEKLIRPGTEETMLWKENPMASNSLRNWASKIFFPMGNSKRISAYRLEQEIEYPYDALCDYLTSASLRLIIDETLESIHVLKYVSAVEMVRSRLQGLMNRIRVKESDFDSAVQYSYFVSEEIFKLPFPWKSRYSHIATSMRKFPNEKKVFILQRTYGGSDLKPPGRHVEMTFFGGDIYEACGPSGTSARRTTLGVANMNSFIPSKLMAYGMGKAVQYQYEKTKEQLNKINKVDDEWGNAVQKTAVENAEIDAMIQEYKKKYFGEIAKYPTQ